MGLPSCDLLANAMHGFDAGRHSKYLEAAADAGMDTRDWLIIKALLRRHELRPRDYSTEGVVGVLPTVKTEGGGSVQGLSVPLPLYNIMTAKCSEAVAGQVPHACNKVHPAVLVA